jgi:hypothetical protein
MEFEFKMTMLEWSIACFQYYALRVMYIFWESCPRESGPVIASCNALLSIRGAYIKVDSSSMHVDALETTKSRIESYLMHISELNGLIEIRVLCKYLTLFSCVKDRSHFQLATRNSKFWVVRCVFSHSCTSHDNVCETLVMRQSPGASLLPP